jgi:hypothetical protein
MKVYGVAEICEALGLPITGDEGRKARELVSQWANRRHQGMPAPTAQLKLSKVKVWVGKDATKLERWIERQNQRKP